MSSTLLNHSHLADMARRSEGGIMFAPRELAVLKGFGRGGLVLGFYLGREPAAVEDDGGRAGAESLLRANSLLSISLEAAVTVFVMSSVFGMATGLLVQMTVADALDVDCSKVSVEFGKGRGERNGGTLPPTMVATNMNRLRQAAYAARGMLVSAAAGAWSVRPDECATISGFVEHGASGKRASYGDLTLRAATLPLPGSSVITGLLRNDD